MEIVTEVVESSVTQLKTATARCSDAGENLSAVSGGARLSGVTTGVAIIGTYPTGNEGEVPSGWIAEARYDGSDEPGSWSLTAYAVCADVQ